MSEDSKNKPGEPRESSSSIEIEWTETIAEASFYIQQELFDEAEEVLSQMREQYAGKPDILAKVEDMAAKIPGSERQDDSSEKTEQKKELKEPEKSKKTSGQGAEKPTLSLKKPGLSQGSPILSRLRPLSGSKTPGLGVSTLGIKLAAKKDNKGKAEEEKKKAEEAKKAEEEKKKAEEAKKAEEEKKKAEEAKKPEAVKKSGKEKKAEEREKKKTEKKKAKEAKKAEEAKKPEEEAKKAEEEAKKAEEAKKPEEAKKAEEGSSDIDPNSALGKRLLALKKKEEEQKELKQKKPFGVSGQKPLVTAPGFQVADKAEPKETTHGKGEKKTDSPKTAKAKKERPPSALELDIEDLDFDEVESGDDVKEDQQADKKAGSKTPSIPPPFVGGVSKNQIETQPASPPPDVAEAEPALAPAVDVELATDDDQGDQIHAEAKEGKSSIKEFLVENKLYAGIGAGVLALIILIVIIVFSTGSDEKERDSGVEPSDGEVASRREDVEDERGEEDPQKPGGEAIVGHKDDAGVSDRAVPDGSATDAQGMEAADALDATASGVKLQLKIEPEDVSAVVTFRGKEYRGNNVSTSSLDVSDKKETIVIRARGYEQKRVQINLDKDQTLKVKLEPVKKRDPADQMSGRKVPRERRPPRQRRPKKQRPKSRLFDL